MATESELEKALRGISLAADFQFSFSKCGAAKDEKRKTAAYLLPLLEINGITYGLFMVDGELAEAPVGISHKQPDNEVGYYAVTTGSGQIERLPGDDGRLFLPLVDIPGYHEDLGTTKDGKFTLYEDSPFQTMGLQIGNQRLPLFFANGTGEGSLFKGIFVRTDGTVDYYNSNINKEEKDAAERFLRAFYSRNLASALGKGRTAEGHEGKLYDNISGRPEMRQETVEKVNHSLEALFQAQFSGESGKMRIRSRECRGGQRQWTLYAEMTREVAVAAFRQELDDLKEKIAAATELRDTSLGGFRRRRGIASLAQFTFNTGDAGKYRAARESLQSLGERKQVLEHRLVGIESSNWWREERDGKSYRAYPYPAVMEITTGWSGSREEGSSLYVRVCQQPSPEETERLGRLARQFARQVQARYGWLDVHLDPIDLDDTYWEEIFTRAVDEDTGEIIGPAAPIPH